MPIARPIENCIIDVHWYFASLFPTFKIVCIAEEAHLRAARCAKNHTKVLKSTSVLSEVLEYGRKRMKEGRKGRKMKRRRRSEGEKDEAACNI